MGWLDSADKNWLRSNQPQLLIIERPKLTIVKGRLKINHSEAKYTVDDSYQIRLELSAKTSLPRAFETGGRLERVLKEKRIESKADLHMYPDNRLCFAAPQELKLVYLKNPGIEHLIENYAVPFFYAQSYFEKTGSWPWPHLSHGAKGLVEWYLDNRGALGALEATADAIKNSVKDNEDPSVASSYISRALQRESMNPRSKCLCGSGRTYINCLPGHMALTRLAIALRR